MPTYKVDCAMPVFLSITVEADDEADAIDKAYEHMSLTGFCGNGGTDKLIGTYEPNVSLEPGDSPLEGNGWQITAEEVT